MAILLFIITLFFLKPAFGSETNSEIIFSTGNARILGDLGGDASSTVFMLQSRSTSSRTIPMWTDIIRTEIGIGIDLIYLERRNGPSEFLFSPDTSMVMKGIFLIPTACFFRNVDYRLCFGLGNGTLNTNTAKNRQDYGTWNYQIDGHIQLTDKVMLKLISKYIGKIEQRIAERDSSFSLGILAMGLGVRF